MKPARPQSVPKREEDTDPRDRKIFNLNAERWAKLQETLKVPPRVLPRMEKLLTEPGYFESNLGRDTGNQTMSNDEKSLSTVRECSHKAGKLFDDGIWRCKRCHVQMSCRDCDGDLATPCVPGLCRCYCHSAAL